MKVTSITQPKDAMVELISQGLSEKIDVAGSQIQDFVFNGALQFATETVRDLTTLLEDLVWQSYLTMLFNCKMILERLKILGGKKGLRFVSYQEVQITLPTGTKIPVRSPFFVKASPRRGRKKRGPQKRGNHLLLTLLGFVNKVEPGLAFHAVQLALIAPSFDIADQILKQEGVKLGPNKIRLPT